MTYGATSTVFACTCGATFRTNGATAEERAAHEDVWFKFHDLPGHEPASVRRATYERNQARSHKIPRVHFDPNRRARPVCGTWTKQQEQITHDAQRVTCQLCLASMARTTRRELDDDLDY